MEFYTLKAELGRQTVFSGVLAESEEQARVGASFKVIDLAHKNPEGVWAKGGVTLTDPRGKVLETMPTK